MITNNILNYLLLTLLVGSQISFYIIFMFTYYTPNFEATLQINNIKEAHFEMVLLTFITVMSVYLLIKCYPKQKICIG
jgi:hypothetical protein